MKKILIVTVLAALVTGAGAAAWNYEEWFTIPRLRGALLSNLKDAESARFRNERVSEAGVLCGEVNARNSNGAYTGFTRFLSLARDKSALPETGWGNWRPPAEGVVAKAVELREALQLQMKLQDVAGRPPSDTEIRQVQFEQLWATYCRTG